VAKDRVFETKIEKQFQFDESVALVFDDMLNRSVPFYRENIDLITQVIDSYTVEDSRVLDLGSSTASLLLEIERKLSEKRLHLIGIDNSTAMVEQARKKISALKSGIKLLEGDILTLDYPEVDIAVLNYTLQFIRPLQREKLLSKIYSSLSDGGVLIITEKVISSEPKLNKKLIDIYYRFKKSQGYSEYEIVQKREALENILVPYTEEENRKLLQSAGFSHIETLFRWVNFSTFIAIK
jgi:tRNA (cmo5U34)-methyltransferase